MPCFVNLGAYVDEGTMIDTWASVGSCAQVGKNCHVSGGAGIGGVLEPLQAGNKNVFIAIALSMSVLLFWAAFFETPKPINNSTPQLQKKNNENIITPSINETLKVEEISREEAIKNSERIKIVNDSIIILS